MASPRVLVTRPEREAARWTADLRAAGFDAVSLPLIEIATVADPTPLHAAWQQRGRYQALMFVSAAAVAHFFAQADGDWPADVRCWATGPGTVAALRRVGIAEPAIDAPPADAPQFDSEALWDRVRDQVVPGAEVLVVRGGDAQGRPAGRDWLGDRIEAAGGRCSRLVAYRRLPPAFDGAQRRLAGDASKPPAVWLFSSAEAIGNLCRAMPDTAWREARAVATHWRIAQAAQGVGFGTVRAAQPGLDAVVASIESLR